MKITHIFCGLFLTALLVLSIGCAGMEQGTIGAQEAGQYNLVTKDEVPLKQSGPNQTIPALKTLEPGTRVRIISGGDLFVYVETVDGDRGFVPRAALDFQKQDDNSSGITGH